MPRVLIVDDDPISLRFLEAALKQSGCDVIGAETCAAALSAAAANGFDLLLLDCNLPDGSGDELLAALRQRVPVCPAIATSAEFSVEQRSQRRTQGFADCIEKPVSLTRLYETLRPWLGNLSVPLLETGPALAAIGGSRDVLKTLRGMFVQELTALQEEVVSGRLAGVPLLDRLHRLRASCGFCGAPRLAEAAIALEQVLRATAAESGAHRERFLACCRETALALTD